MHPLLSFLGRLLFSSFLFGELYDLPAFLQSLVSLSLFHPLFGALLFMVAFPLFMVTCIFFLNEVICISCY
ncbi:hypothetical protein GQ55_1G087100 [Panicum hallii var. hallii]|uniref:Uncharacterized protein n=1 Tax=Panicum hallii var. hallii TaxID=1504633 RepID=A0A2T7F3R1_9POAL|nr:hypothetical protein GQ55_1G087100 [Panicum hallii var. hallii]